MTLKATTRRTFRVDVVKNCVIFPQIIHQIVPFARDFLPVKFFLSVSLKTFVSSYLKWHRQPMK